MAAIACGLIVCNPGERRIQRDALLPVLEPKVRDHLRGIGRGRPARDRGGKAKRQPQQQSVTRQNDYLRTGHKFVRSPSQLGSPGRFNPKKTQQVIDFIGRGSWIRTNDLQYPKLPRYQAALYPDRCWEMTSIHA